MGSLRVTLFGGFQVRDASGAEVSVAGGKAALLLTYLALSPGEAHSRDKILGLLWSDRGEAQARGSLRQAIWALRRALAGIEPCPLVVRGEHLLLDRAAVDTDLSRLNDLLSEGSEEALRKAAALYRGRLLEGVRVRDAAFEAFLRDEQERLHTMLVGAHLRFLNIPNCREADESVAVVARNLLEIDPLQEAAHRALIGHYACTGQTALAVRQYRTCSERLERELDVGPSAETRALMDEITHGAPSAADGPESKGVSPEQSGGPAKPHSWIDEKPSIAVLPFLNLSGDPGEEYFSDGLTEDIINALARWRSFPVIARNSSFAYKDKAVDVKQVGRELSAPYVLEGSVRRSGRRVRVNVQLVDTQSGHHHWADKFDRDLEDVFALQDEITERVAATLELALGKVELLRSKEKPPRNLDAWDFCLRGRARMDEWTKEGTARAREMFERAIEADPNDSEAYADLAWTHSRDLLLECTDDRPTSAAKMFEAAQRAVALDDESWRARYRLSTAHTWRGETDLAVAEGWRAVELNPMNAVARHALGNKLDLAGDPQGIPMMEEAQKLNPQDPQRNMHLTFLARAYLNARDYEKAVACARHAIRLQPGYPNGHYILAIALGHLGLTAEARAALDACDRLVPGFVSKRAKWQPYADPASNEHLHEGLRKARGEA